MILFLLNINFQFGDFVGIEQSSFISALWDCIPAFIGSIIAVAGSLWLFNRQILANKQIEKDKSSLEAARICHYFAYVISETIKLSKGQSIAIDKFIKDYEVNTDKQLVKLRRHSFGFVNNFTQSNNIDVIFNAYMMHVGSENKDIVDFNIVIKSIFTVKELNDILIEGNNEAVVYDFNRRVNYDANYKKLMPLLINFFDSLLITNQPIGEITTQEFRPMLEKYLSEIAIDNKNANIKFIHENLISPTIDIVEKNKLYNMKDSTEIINLLINLNSLFFEIINKNKFHLDNLKSDMQLMDNISEGLRTSSNKLRTKYNYSVD